MMESGNPLLNQIKDTVIPKFGELIPWYGTGPVDDVRDIYRYDRAAVEKSDLIIAEVSYPSHGVGMELMHAIYLGKPIIAIAQEGKKVSRMVQGVDYERFEFLWYKNLEDLEAKLTEKLQVIYG